MSLYISFSTSLLRYHCRGFSDTCRALDLNDKHVQHELERQERGVSASSRSPPSPSLCPFLSLSTSCYLGSLYDSLSRQKTMGVNGGRMLWGEAGYSYSLAVQPLHQQRTLWRQHCLSCVIIHSLLVLTLSSHKSSHSSLSLSSSSVADLLLF